MSAQVLKLLTEKKRLDRIMADTFEVFFMKEPPGWIEFGEKEKKNLETKSLFSQKIVSKSFQMAKPIISWGIWAEIQ